MEFIAGALVAMAFSLIGKIIWDWVKNGKTKDDGQSCMMLGKNHEFDEIHANIIWLKEIHNKTDEDGVPLWFMPRRAIKALFVMTANSDKTLDFLKKIDTMLDKILERDGR